MKVYLDNSATTALDAQVLKAMMPYFNDKFGNASSIHSFGQKTREAVDKSRAKIAKVLHCLPEEIIFTSGGSEADNLAIKGIVESVGFRPHLITSRVEHHAVLKTVEELERRGRIEATYLRVDKLGRVNPEDLRKAIKKNTLLISIMYVNNETGVIQPIREIGKAIEKVKRQKLKMAELAQSCHSVLDTESIDSRFRGNDVGGPYFHTDAVQAAQCLTLNVDYLHLDMMTLSAHKIYGPKGIGLLYVKKGTPLISQITGGEQENGRRAGTENVAGIVGFAQVLRKTTDSKIEKLRDYLEEKIKKEIKNVQISGDLKNRAPHISNISFSGAEGESILLSLDLEGIAASSGSACTSGSLKSSHVLKAMGIDTLEAQSSIRFSFSKNNTKEEIDYTIKKLRKIIKRLRRISPKWTTNIQKK